MSRSRDIAAILGATEAANPTNAAVGSGGTDSATVISLIQQNAVDSGVVLSLASVQINNTVDSSYVALRQAGGGGGVTSYANTAALPTAAAGNEGNLGYVEDINKLFVSIGSTWSPVATVNASPTLDISPEGIIRLDRNGSNTTITLTATDADSGATLTFSSTADTNFDGLATLSQSNNVFTITPKNQASATTTSGTVTFSVTDGQAISSTQSTFTLSFTTAAAGYLNFQSTSLGLMGSTNSATGLLGGQHSAVDRVHGVYVAAKPEQLDITNAITDRGMFGVAKRDVNGNYGYIANSAFFNPASNYSTGHEDFNAEKYLGATIATGGGDRIFAVGGLNTAPPNIYMFAISDSDTPLAEVNPGTSGPASNTRYIKKFADDYTTALTAMTTQYAPIACDSSGTHIVICNPGNNPGGSTNQGAAEYIYRDPSTDTLTKRQFILSPNASLNTYFGNSITMQPDGLRMAIGEEGASGPSPYTGAMGKVHIYTRDSANDTTWALEDTVQPTITILNATESRIMNAYGSGPWATGQAMGFGTSVAISDDGKTLVAGAPTLYVYNTSSNLTYHGCAWVCNRTGSTWSVDEMLYWGDWENWTDLSGNADKNIGTIQGTSTAQQGAYFGLMTGINPDGSVIAIGTPNSGIYVNPGNGAAIMGTAEHGNIYVYNRDSDNGTFLSGQRNWVNGPTSSYSFGRTRHTTFSQGGQFPFLTNTAFAAGRHYNSNTDANTSVYIYDSA